MSGHTPGPWRWDGVSVLTPNGNRLLTTGVCLTTGNHAGQGEAGANAYLIAAAPELLSVLIDILGVAGRINERASRYDPCPFSLTLIEKANAAVAKARGEGGGV